MGLKDIKIPTVDVLVSEGNSFPVRGLSTDDINYLVRAHGSDLKELWDEFLENKVDLSKLAVTEIYPLIKVVIGRVPAAMLEMIAIAADADDDDLPTLRKLPIGTQIDAVSKVLGMTLKTDGDWSKTMETVLKMLGGANGALGEMVKNQLPS